MPTMRLFVSQTAEVFYDKSVYVVVQFYPWFKLYFPLFFFMLIYDNEYETKENKN